MGGGWRGRAGAGAGAGAGRSLGLGPCGSGAGRRLSAGEAADWQRPPCDQRAAPPRPPPAPPRPSPARRKRKRPAERRSETVRGDPGPAAPPPPLSPPAGDVEREDGKAPGFQPQGTREWRRRVGLRRVPPGFPLSAGAPRCSRAPPADRPPAAQPGTEPAATTPPRPGPCRVRVQGKVGSNKRSREKRWGFRLMGKKKIKITVMLLKRPRAEGGDNLKLAKICNVFHTRSNH